MIEEIRTYICEVDERVPDTGCVSLEASSRSASSTYLQLFAKSGIDLSKSGSLAADQHDLPMRR